MLVESGSERVSIRFRLTQLFKAGAGAGRKSCLSLARGQMSKKANNRTGGTQRCNRQMKGKKKTEMREQKVCYHNMLLSVRQSCPRIAVQPVLESLGRKHLIIPKLSRIFSPPREVFSFFFLEGGSSLFVTLFLKEIYSDSLYRFFLIHIYF